jgi:hypothetical protein
MSNHLYTITNRQTANAVVGMEILKNGALRFVKDSPFPTGGKGSASSQSQNGARTAGTVCWSALGRGEKKLYMTNADSVLVFDVSGNRLDQVQSLDVTDIPNPVLHDLILGPDGNFLYAIEQRKRRILVYSIAKDGRVALRGERVIDGPSFPLGLAIG